MLTIFVDNNSRKPPKRPKIASRKEVAASTSSAHCKIMVAPAVQPKMEVRTPTPIPDDGSEDEVSIVKQSSRDADV
jgi:hypothetical protein